MAVKTQSVLKAQFMGTDPNDHNTDVVDSLGAAASATSAGLVELATNAEARAGSSTALSTTPANVANMFAGLKFITVDGRNGAGAITATGAVVGDVVVGVAGLTAGALGAATASFESAITVADQVQQSSASNLSANDYLVVLRAVA